ncbi:MAG: hypothetical protein IPP89_01545 [Saprospiraceae bacterium]|nr:hypothetical protein [Candidatus Brachybacter algidus]MBL0117679.1 hypothetical protein [Candidatus Brachybacter algidus]
MSNGGAQEFVGLTALKIFNSFPNSQRTTNHRPTIRCPRAETQKLEAVYKKLDDLEELKKSILQKHFQEN